MVLDLAPGNWASRKNSSVCHGLEVTVAHYPPGISRWNPIEQRLFGEISKNWASISLVTYETMLKYIRSTKTTTGLKIKAHLVRKKYKKGNKVPD